VEGSRCPRVIERDMKREKPLTHIDASGEASMVDVTGKPVLFREAVARGEIRVSRETLEMIESHTVAKGNVLATPGSRDHGRKKTGILSLCTPCPSRIAKWTLKS